MTSTSVKRSGWQEKLLMKKPRWNGVAKTCECKREGEEVEDEIDKHVSDFNTCRGQWLK
jgi:hypothetical protein